MSVLAVRSWGPEITFSHVLLATPRSFFRMPVVPMLAAGDEWLGGEVSGSATIQLLRLDEAAAIAKLSEKTLRRGMEDPQNRLRVHRFGRAIRIDRADLDAWLRAHAAVPEPVSDPVLAAISPEARRLVESLLSPQPVAKPGRVPKPSRKVRGMSARKTRRNQVLDCARGSSVHADTMDENAEAPSPTRATAVGAGKWA